MSIALLASNFPSENPRTQARNFPYSKPLATCKEANAEKTKRAFIYQRLVGETGNKN